jgi:hypothetical protein
MLFRSLGVKQVPEHLSPNRHCDERSEEAISELCIVVLPSCAEMASLLAMTFMVIPSVRYFVTCFRTDRTAKRATFKSMKIFILKTNYLQLILQ